MQRGDTLRVVSTNVSRPRVVDWGKMRLTGIFKQPVEGRVAIQTYNLAGDGQGDLVNHGGQYQAVYAYFVESYRYWERELGETLPWGTFGENLTVEGAQDNEIMVGDIFQLGDTLLKVTRPRIPCYKLATKLERPDIIERFLKSGHPGFYMLVLREGSVAAGDHMQLIARNPESLSMPTIVDLIRGAGDIETLRHAVTLEDLGPSLLESLQKKL